MKGIWLALVFVVTSAVGSDQTAGVVRDAAGEVVLERNGQPSPLVTGAKVRQDDVIRTGTDGSVGIIFRDDTLMSLGPDSRIAVEEFVFEPREQSFSFVANMSKGTASVASGLIGKLSPDSVKFETPDATLGVRGTRFLIRVEPR